MVIDGWHNQNSKLIQKTTLIVCANRASTQSVTCVIIFMEGGWRASLRTSGLPIKDCLAGHCAALTVGRAEGKDGQLTQLDENIPTSRIDNIQKKHQSQSNARRQINSKKQKKKKKKSIQGQADEVWTEDKYRLVGGQIVAERRWFHSFHITHWLKTCGGGEKHNSHALTAKECEKTAKCERHVQVQWNQTGGAFRMQKSPVEDANFLSKFFFW